ncbi:MAG: carbonic anhydrase [Thermogemmatispora sp.]|uniref:beta-class carbonic anhydrase n=1 Tax=Thermogemmatispora sp. TaxID=1968838 RepID=UPI0026139DE6|nr:carbonic anhydrase [Thermogemmatispora sp.]MBX5455395.1 carbonic anhydrase [Thermogemmatispora sp.]
MSLIEELLAANERYAATFQKGELPLPPAKKLAIVTCMDARIDPARILGLEEGDAHVIRNAGGRTAEALRSLIISQQLLGTRTIVVIHHTDCGMLTFENADLQRRLQEQFGVDASTIDFLPFKDLEQSVRDDIALLRSSPFLLKESEIVGFIYDVHSGRLLPVH